jgi:hypothetical protein
MKEKGWDHLFFIVRKTERISPIYFDLMGKVYGMPGLHGQHTIG